MHELSAMHRNSCVKKDPRMGLLKKFEDGVGATEDDYPGPVQCPQETE
jgi:hypothetical protein